MPPLAVPPPARIGVAAMSFAAVVMAVRNRMSNAEEEKAVAAQEAELAEGVDSLFAFAGAAMSAAGSGAAALASVGFKAIGDIDLEEAA